MHSIWGMAWLSRILLQVPRNLTTALPRGTNLYVPRQLKSTKVCQWLVCALNPYPQAALHIYQSHAFPTITVRYTHSH